MSGDHLPPQVQTALRCAEKSDSLSRFGVCTVANEGGGEAQRIAACYVEGQGVPAAVAVCLAARDLTQDQRIVLECAAETNGAIPATATCAGGKLATKELINCKGKRFGEESCFGEGNELRKLAKSMGMDIGPHSVVADIASIQLQIVDVTTAPMLEAGSQVVTTVAKIATDNNFLPDPAHPGTIITQSVVPGPIGKAIGNAVNNYCDHNRCPFDGK
jgi:hypothetical protein